MAISFPELFNCASNKYAKVIDYVERRGDSIVWGPVFRRSLNEVEEGQFHSQLTSIANVFISINGKDRRIWMATNDGMFSVSSFFTSMHRDVVVTHINWATLWSMKAPPRVIAFGWSALRGGHSNDKQLKTPAGDYR